MRSLATFDGRRGEIAIIENRETGARSYFEDGVFQSEATPDGISLFAYVHLMARLLWPACDVLLLGCAAGSLATMLQLQGKRVTVVDDNPLSFDIARQFFGLPSEVVCVVEDFRDYLARQRACFDAIGIDIGAPGMRFDEQFNPDVCQTVRSRLATKGQIVMNIVASHDIDPKPDRVLAMLAADDLNGWIYDRPGKINRNAILAAVPWNWPYLGPRLDRDNRHIERVEWRCRRERRRLGTENLPHTAR